MGKTPLLRMTICTFLLTAFQSAQAQTIQCAGHTWKVTSASMAGVAPGNPANVNIDPDGYLHLQITNRDGKWTAAEVFTTDDMRYGTYQWVVEGDVYNMDPTTVPGRFTYRPVPYSGADTTNRIDIELSHWSKTDPHPS